MNNRRRVALLLVAVMILSSMPFAGGSYAYASVLNEDELIMADLSAREDPVIFDDNIPYAEGYDNEEAGELLTEIQGDEEILAEDELTDEPEEAIQYGSEDELKDVITENEDVLLTEGEDDGSSVDMFSVEGIGTGSEDTGADAATVPKTGVSTGSSIGVATGSSITASVKPGPVKKGTKVILTCNRSDIDIYYSINSPISVNERGELTGNPGLYVGAIKISDNYTIYAVGNRNGIWERKVYSFRYTIASDWGDIRDEVQGLFGWQVIEVPEGIWFLVNDNGVYRVCYSGNDTLIKRPYTGAAVTIDENVEVFCGTKKLWEGRDYSVKYLNNIDAGKATMTIKGKGNFSGTSLLYFTITSPATDSVVVTTGTVYTLTEGKRLGWIKPVICLGSRGLGLHKDFECEYSDGATEKTKGIAGKEYYVSLVFKQSKFNLSGRMDNAYKIKVLKKNDPENIAMSNVKVAIPKLEWGQRYPVKDLFDNSNGKTAVARVTNGSTVLVYGRDFVLENEAAVISDTGTYDVILRGTEGRNGGASVSYWGSKVVALTINGIQASNVKVGGMATAVEYKGRPLVLSDLDTATKDGCTRVTLYTLENKTMNKLNPGADYDVSFINTGMTGKAEVVFKLKGRCKGTIKKRITIRAADIRNTAFTVKLSRAEYSKNGAVPLIDVAYQPDAGSAAIHLTEGIDYTVSYKNNTKQGTATATIKGKGNYAGSRSADFTVEKTLPGAIEVVAKDKIADNRPGSYKQVPRLMEGGKALSKGKDGVSLPGKDDWRYYNAATGRLLMPDETVPAGTCIMVCAEIIIGADSPYYDGEEGRDVKKTVSGFYRIIAKDKDISKASVSIVNDDWLIFSNGDALLPANADIKVVLNGKTLEPNQYEIVSVTGNRLLGSASMVIRGKGAYGGTRTVKVKIKAGVFK